MSLFATVAGMAGAARMAAAGMRGSSLFSKSNFGLAGLAGIGTGKRQVFRSASKTIRGTLGHTYGGIWPFLPALALLQARDLPQGEKLPSALGFLAGGLAGVPGALAAGPVGALATTALWAGGVQDFVTKQINKMAQRDRKTARFEMGNPRHVNTDAALTMRQAAAKQMAGSLMNARQHLGREAAFYHQ